MKVPGVLGRGSTSLRLMAGASALTTLGALPPFLLGAQAVWVRDDLTIGLGLFGIAVSVFFALAALGSYLAAVLLEALGRRTSLVVAGMLVAAGGGSMAVLVRGPASLLTTMAVLGLGNAACQTVANLSMARALPMHRRGLGFGVKQSAVPLAIMLGGLAVPTLGGQLGWRSTFVTTALIGLSVAAWALLHAIEDIQARVTTETESDQPPWWPLLMCGLAISFASAAANFFGSFIASWGYEVGISATTMGLLMAAGSAGSIVVRIYSGYRADGRHGGNLPVVALQMLVGAVCLVGLMAGTPLTVIGFGFVGFAVGWSWPGLLLFAAARLGRDSPARASSVIQAGAFIGGAAGPMGFGALAGTVGFPITWLIASGCFVIASLLILVARTLFTADLQGRPPRTPLTWGGARIHR